jgi:hypothetical protein
MKKIAFLASLVSLVWQSDAVLSTKDWGNSYSQFNSLTNLIRGYVLLDSNLVKYQRFWGNIEYNAEKPDCRGSDSCSFKDKGIDPMADLLVQLFPSAGVALNAGGTASIQTHFTSEELIDFISGMFKIDADVRKNGLKSEVFSDIRENNRNKFVKKYFNSKDKERTKLYRLGKNIANAILLERERDDCSPTRFLWRSSKNPYPPFYTNDLICAYAWSVLNSNQLDELSEKLAEKLNYERGKYTDEFTECLVNPNSNCLFPFHPGDVIVENGRVEFEGNYFADCVETTLRHFCTSIFSRAIDENGSRTISLDLDRIPEGSPLREFFAPKGMPQNIENLAKDESLETRQKWANIVSGLPHIDYVKNHCELNTGWANFIKTFCYLMKGYSGSEKAANQIQKINQEIESMDSPEKVINILNNLLTIRTDVELIAKSSKTDPLNRNSKILGKVSIYPNVSDPSVVQTNKLAFYNGEGHACLESIPRKRNDSYSYKSSSWIEKLYDNWELAVRGYESIMEGGSTEITLSESIYPLLDFYFRMGKGRVEYQAAALLGILGSSIPHIDAVARSIYDSRNCNMSPGICLTFAEDPKFVNDDELIPLSSEQEIAFYKSTLKFSKDWRVINRTIEILEEKAPEELSKMFFKTDENGNLSDELSINIDEKTSIFDLILARVVTKHYKKIDPFIEKYIGEIVIDSDQRDMEIVSSFRKIIDIFWFLSQVVFDRDTTHPFEKSMSEIYIKHTKSFFEHVKKCKGEFIDYRLENLMEVSQEGILNPLKLMNFDENDETLRECVDYFLKFGDCYDTFSSAEEVLSYLGDKRKSRYEIREENRRLRGK